MSVTFTGASIPETRRIITGFPSLDKAMGDGNGRRGYPVRTMTELYGAAGIGKTTVMMSLGAIFANALGGRIAFIDYEGQSFDTVSNSLEMNGYLGEVNLCRDGAKTHEDMMDNMISDLRGDVCSVALLDSIGAFTPVAELEGSVADANMGQKARVVGNWSRKMVNVLLQKEAMCLYVSHQHSNIGFVGTHTSGGETKRFLNSVQLELKRKDEYDTGWLVEGKVKKSRYGVRDAYFRMFIIGGQGAHTGLSAVFDCVAMGLAEIERNVVKMEGVSYGKVARMVENWQDRSLFAPFLNVLASLEKPAEVEDEPLPLEIEPKKRGRKKREV